MSELQYSPFPNSARRLHLVRRRFPPALLPIMSPRKSRSLWCFLEGPQFAGTILKPYNVFDIPNKTNVFQLKGLIREAIKQLHTVDAEQLQLLQTLVSHSD